MSNSNTNLQTQTSNALHNAIMEAGGKDHPPMLASGNYVQWKSKIKRYIDTKPNNELIHYCLQNPPYKYKWTKKTVPVAEGIDNDIYSTVDACPNACEMWKAIERLKQGESINVQDLETNLYWEFGKFTSRDGESLESYYSRFYKIRNQCDVTNHQVNVQFLLQLQPEWQRFVTLVKQSQELKTVSYHKLYDILKQHQNEVNEIRAERLARTANPLALNCYGTDDYEMFKETENYKLRLKFSLVQEESTNQQQHLRTSSITSQLIKIDLQELTRNWIKLDRNDDTDDDPGRTGIGSNIICICNNSREHPEQPESSNDNISSEQGDTNNHYDSSDICLLIELRMTQDETDDLDQNVICLASLIQKLKCEMMTQHRNKFWNHQTRIVINLKDIKKFQAELDKYKDVNYASKVEIDCAKAKGDLITVEIVLFIVDSGCSKHMTGNLKLLTNFVEKFLGTVKFGNDQIAPILGYGDLVQGTILIKGSRAQICIHSLQTQLLQSNLLNGLESTSSSSCSELQRHGISLITPSCILAKEGIKTQKRQLATTPEQYGVSKDGTVLLVKPSVKFFSHLWFSMLLPSRFENLDKNEEKSVAVNFSWYSTQSKAYRKMHYIDDENLSTSTVHRYKIKGETSSRHVDAIQEQGETSSHHVDSSNMHTFYQHHPSAQRWTKDHPLEQVIGNPS
ncbi:hypothetical protein Tco_0655974 [Tanacetum coccineum]|uniref:Retrovirus-related Pol polyprotein from transposon TNT 1-94-like beta-barrel domain-containing protein n=1 Tax=Tanacetum coccineum TaxID=301880 RepID=A0ABQ4X840_9ASTR